MGSANTKAFKDLLDESACPTPPSARKAVEDVLDPRSPAIEFPRTPIQVEKTPDKVVDPRSPTYGIMRTPIYAGEEDDFRRAAVPADTPVRPLSEVYVPKEEVAVLPSPDIDDRPRTDSGSSVELMSRSCSNPDLSTDMRSLIRPAASAQRKMSTPSKKTTKPLLQQSNSNSSGVRDKPSPRSPLSILSDFPSRRQRKPSDTPKAILQRKHASKLLFASKKHSGDFQVYCDKENASHK